MTEEAVKLILYDDRNRACLILCTPKMFWDRGRCLPTCNFQLVDMNSMWLEHDIGMINTKDLILH